MRRISDIRELARFMIETGYTSAYDHRHIPPYQGAIQKVMSLPGSAFVDELGFVKDKDAERLYLRNRIDFQWLCSQVELLPPLRANAEANVIGGDWIEIRGGTEPPPSQDREGRNPRWAFWK
jgi:hypothetical protein